MYLRLVYIFILSWILFSSVSFADCLNEEQIKFELQQIQNRKNYINQAEIIALLQSSLHYINESKTSYIKIKGYKNIINNFSTLVKRLKNESKKINSYWFLNKKNFFSREGLNQELFQINTRILCLEKELQEEQMQCNSIIHSLVYLPKQKDKIQKLLNDIEKRKQILLVPTTSVEWAQFVDLQAKEKYVMLKIKEFDFAQLSTSFRMELSRMRIDSLKERIEQLEKINQILYQKLNQLKKDEYEKITSCKKFLLKTSNSIPNIVNLQIEKSKKFFIYLDQQEKKIKEIITQQRTFYSNIFRVYQTIYLVQNKKNMLYESPIFGKTFRLQISQLPKLPNLKKIDIDIANVEEKILSVKERMKCFIKAKKITQIYKNRLEKKQYYILNKQILIQEYFLKALLSNFNIQILELTKLKSIGIQLKQSLIEAKKIVHQHLFWMTDIPPIDFYFFIEVGKSIYKIFTFNTLQQLMLLLILLIKKKITIFLLILIIAFTIFYYILLKYYRRFLKESSAKVNKIYEDHFSLTLQNIFFSILISFSFPCLLLILGFVLKYFWSCLILVAIGDSFIKVSFLLWILITFFNFSHKNGLFIKHFNWSKKRVKCMLYCYKLFIFLIIPLILVIITFDKYNDQELVSTIERLFFISLCIGISIIFNNFKNFNLVSYYDKNGNNFINKLIWNIVIFFPLICSFAAFLGYLSIAKMLLFRIEISILTLFFILVNYHVFNRWMLIQRRCLYSERKKECNTNEKNDNNDTKNKFSKIDKKELNVDIIGSQSLRLVRLVFTLIALLSIIFLWSELRSAFGFLENIKLWHVSTSDHGENNTQYITLSSVLTSILILIITIKMVRNLPSLLELSLLQHLNLTPGTGYAITTLTKYTIMFLGGLIGFTMVGIEWSKLQWLIAALGVGLGFGLQEMFANFISGLMILFEKPVRIGDTITIRNLTGNITRINTRATTITDWDKKEIIVPNKAFITEQFVNWSLSDTITRVVIHVPAPDNANIKQITKMLIKSAKDCSLVLRSPSPEVFLMDLQQGLPIFELRMYVAEMSHRMPLRHQVHSSILESYRKNDIKLPFPPIQVRIDQIKLKNLSINTI